MKKLLYILPISVALMSACTNKSNVKDVSSDNEIKGSLANDKNDGETIYLFQSAGLNKPFEKIDSTIIKNGSFSFKGDYLADDNMFLSYLSLKSPEKDTPQVLFVDEKGSIDVKIDSVPTISGTPLNDAYQKLLDEVIIIDNQIGALSLSKENTDTNKITELYTNKTNIIYGFLKANISNVLGEFLFVRSTGLLSLDQATELLKDAKPELQAMLAPLLENANASLAQGDSKFVGSKYINISGDTPSGKKISLSDYVGKNKLVLVDFWASWCRPCILEMPNVVKAYAKYKEKGFEIVGVSLDENKKDWSEALTDLNMNWPQMSDLKGWKSQLSAAYGVESIPFTILIDKDGNIIAENLRGDQLEKILGDILK